jgi:hypothetical protein
MQELLQRLRVSKMRTIPPHQQSGGVMEQYIKAIEKHLPNHCIVKLPIFLLGYMAPTHDTMDLAPSNLVFRRELSHQELAESSSK